MLISLKEAIKNLMTKIDVKRCIHKNERETLNKFESIIEKETIIENLQSALYQTEIIKASINSYLDFKYADELDEIRLILNHVIKKLIKINSR